MRRVLLATWMVCVLVWALIASAQASATDAAFRVYRLADPTVPPAQVVAGRHDAGAIALEAATIKPAPHVAEWWRLDIQRDIPRQPPHVLVLKVHNGTVARLWLPHHDHAIVRSQAPAHFDASFSASLEVFPLPDGLHAGDRIYLQVTTHTSVPIPVWIRDEQSLRVEDRWRAENDMLIYGTLLALVLVGIGFGLSLRETDFLLLGCAMGLVLLFLLDDRGELYRVPLLQWIPSTYAMERNLSTLAGVTCVLFMLSYLRMRERTPWLARLQQGILVIYAIVIAASVIPRLNAWTQWNTVSNLALLTSALAGMIAAVRGALAGDHQARMFVGSWLPMIGLLCWRIVEITLHWEPNPILDMAFPASFVLVGILLMIGLGERMLKYKRERDASDLLARRDPLTGIYNRRALDEALHAAALDSGHVAQPLALLFVDLDHFKRINDSHGHDVGDEVLCEAARRIRSALRHGDVVGRYGGEEFVVGLPHTTVAEAAAMGERIRVAVGSQPIACGDTRVPVTVSIGVAILDNGLPGFDAAIKRADRALYASKRDGRDRVSVMAT